MKKVRSKDGTEIAIDVVGSGPPVVLVDGAICRRAFGRARCSARSGCQRASW